ncbi:uncharacterized protein AMSG_09074 [Thecamonas trahens ATCC 50062]|uniref:Uncharacterized protein n=1 Tax=Thecamonas trahens ATCC 50062 TaxID=461836 RepID=A0A0L0DKY6_THETB|nr:hypothetical protein AMSG_09074 [Thecamonas trahens ATCC 50062]KNC52910.1 hypothetical protein AMSG_09074 [Thecamonas trahens ATCC 50062]|eukprot:XP_013755004.1 hypothetical protein AMSG_09074 [Thecamonas trahens ATCC 50062]
MAEKTEAPLVAQVVAAVAGRSASVEQLAVVVATEERRSDAGMAVGAWMMGNEVRGPRLWKMLVLEALERMSQLAAALLAAVSGVVWGALGAPAFKIKLAVAGTVALAEARLPLVHKGRTSLAMEALDLVVVDVRASTFSLAAPTLPRAHGLGSATVVRVIERPAAPLRVWLRFMGDSILALTGVGWIANGVLVALTRRTLMDFALGTRVIDGLAVDLQLFHPRTL